MGNALIRTAVVAGAAIAIAACSSTTSTTPASSTTNMPAAAATSAAAAPAASSSPAQPKTAAAAKSAAARFFGLYTGGQYSLAWTLLTPADRRKIPQATWVAVHAGCPAKSAGLAFQITDVTRTGATAIVTYTLSGVLSKLGSATQAFSYTGGRWWFDFDNVPVYRHGSVKADIAAAKAEGLCASS